MSIYQHFRPEEKEFIDQALSWKEFVTNSYAYKLTDFLDPREQFILQTVIGQNSEMKVMFDGGENFCERKRAIIYPDYLEPVKDDFQLGFFQIIYPVKFVTLTHPQVLGSLLGLGLKRSKFGDILIKGDEIQLVVAKEVSDFIQLNFNQVGRTTVKLMEMNQAQLLNLENELQELHTTVPSLRLDAVLSAASRLARQKIQHLIEQERVKVNWQVVNQPSFQVKEGDLISARGLGRFKLMEIDGKTKKDKWRITVGKQK